MGRLERWPRIQGLSTHTLDFPAKRNSSFGLTMTELRAKALAEVRWKEIQYWSLGTSTIASIPQLAGDTLSELSPRHWTFAGIEVLVIVQDHAKAAHRELPALVLDDLLQVKILNGEVILVESKLAAHRGETGLAHRVPDRILVGEIALHGLDSTVDQHRSIIMLCRIVRGIAAI